MTRCWLGLWLMIAACDAAETQVDDALPRAECVLAVVASDYRSSSVSLLAADGRPCARDLVHSGSRPPGLLTAISGDVVLPTSAPEAGAALVVIDRYPNGIVTIIDPDVAGDDASVTAQYRVAPGFAGNPQDVLVRADGSALVSRLERNPTPSADADDFDDGSDLVIIDVARGDARGRVSLDAAAEPGFDPMPARLARAGGLVWVGLAHLSRAFDAAGPGRVAAVDEVSGALIAPVHLDAQANCAQVTASPSGIWVSCSGHFRRGGTPQFGRSGLAWIDAATREAAWVGTAEALVGAPFGFPLAALDDTRVLAVALGDLQAGRGDRLVVVDRVSGGATTLVSAGAFEIGGILPAPDAGLVLVAIADPFRPRIERLGLADLAPRDAITTSSATGLPPRQLAVIRAPLAP